MKILVKEILSANKYLTPEGYLICQDAVLARTGPQDYYKSEIYEDFEGEDEIISVQRLPEQVFSEATLASFENKPLTDEHPDESVTADNYLTYGNGYSRDVRRGTYNGQEVMIANLVVTNPKIIAEIQEGTRKELSCGYDCDVTEGDNPQQVNIRGNHIALCVKGRAGIAKIRDAEGKKIMSKTAFRNKVYKIINPLIGYTKKDFGIEDILKLLKADGVNAGIDVIHSYEKSDIGNRKLYELNFDEFPDLHLLVYFNMDEEYVTKEINSYFKDSKIPSLETPNIDLKKYVEENINAEKVYEDDVNVVAQFVSRVDARNAIRNSTLKPIGGNTEEEDGLFLVYFEKEEILRLIFDINKANKIKAHSVGDVEFSENFYKENIKILEKKLKTLEKDKLDEEPNGKKKKYNEKDVDKAEANVRAEIEAQIAEYKEKLVGDSIVAKDSGENQCIREWYLTTYSDKLGVEINRGVTFKDLFECLDSHEDVYELLGDGIDTVIRERCFEKLAEIMGVPYSEIYDQWLM